MKKNIYPELFKEVDGEYFSDDKALFFFSCGDLGLRKNVDSLDDMTKCKDIIHSFLTDHNFFKNDLKFKEFCWQMNYQIPDINQFWSINKGAYEDKNYPYLNNYQIITPIRYYFKEKVLQVDSCVLTLSDQHTISLLAHHCDSIEKIQFITHLDFGGEWVNENLVITNEWKALAETLKNPDKYIQEVLGHKDWYFLDLNVEFEAYKEGKYKNHLDDLIYLRELIDQKIKFEFYSLDKNQEKILKDVNLI